MGAVNCGCSTTVLARPEACPIRNPWCLARRGGWCGVAWRRRRGDRRTDWRRGQRFKTVNYGSGPPALAAAWVKQAKSTSGQAVSFWEIGNENYGCWETNNWLAKAPENYAGYKPNVNSTCPMVTEGLANGMTTMATSYAANAKNFMTAMKAQDPNAQLGVPYAFDNTVGGATVGDNQIWNDT